MDTKELKEWIVLFEKSRLRKLQLKEKDFELLLERGEERPPVFEKAPSPKVVEHPSAPVGHIAPTRAPEEKGLFVTSPMVGTYYATPAPDKPPFVKKGDRVSKDTVVCIIEAMKVMNEVKAGVSGTIVEVLCEQAQPIEFGTKLFRVESTTPS